MKNRTRPGLPLALAVAVVSVSTWLAGPTTLRAQPVPEPPTPEAFSAQYDRFDTYWYQGLAELDRYRLEQSRYGEIHEGEAVLVFVTEEFDAQDQVKWDHGDRSDVVPILKLNAYRRFYTGIYPYTIMTSVFTPVDDAWSPTLKVSFTAQEWCGQVYAQLNHRDGQYEGLLHSYFQSEGDRTFTLPETLLEDEIFNRIRLDPDSLPLGSVRVIPASHISRLMHSPQAPVAATAELERLQQTADWNAPVRRYTLTFDETDRRLQIDFEDAFPYRIVSWEESYQALFNPDGGAPERLTTRAVLTNSIMLDYWTHHGNDDAALRDVLGLEY